MVRKAHTKSRKGCKSCKKRHVKCDENYPNCGACQRLGIACTWPTKPDSSASPSAGEPSSIITSSSPSGLAIDDLKLLSFWILYTSTTLSVKAHHQVWQEQVVELSFRHPFLLHGVLAVAAIHKAVIYPAESKSLLLQSSAHMNVAIGVLREKIGNPDPATCVPVFAMSGLLAVHNLGLAQVQPPSAPLTDLLRWIRLIHGQKMTVQQNWIRLLTSEIAPIILSIDTSPKSGKVAEILALNDLVQQANLPEAIRDAYLASIDALHTVFLNVHHHLKTGEMYSVAITLSWTATLTPVVMDLLTAGEQIALIIFLHFAVLFRLQESSWWVRGWAKWTLDAVRKQLLPECLPWIEWPIAQLQEH